MFITEVIRAVPVPNVRRSRKARIFPRRVTTADPPRNADEPTGSSANSSSMTEIPYVGREHESPRADRGTSLPATPAGRGGRSAAGTIVLPLGTVGMPVRSLVKRMMVAPSPTQLTSNVTSLEPPLKTETLRGFSPGQGAVGGQVGEADADLADRDAGSK